MNTPTLDQVYNDALQLPLSDQQLLAELLEPPKTLEQLAEEQGIGPFDFEAARKDAASIWPDDESLDEFLAFLRESRKESGRGLELAP